jgi:DNA-binding protein HU-beta
MNKNDVIAEVAKKADLPKDAAEKAVDAFTSTVSGFLQQGQPVILEDFGTFEVTEKEGTGTSQGKGEQSGCEVRLVAEFHQGELLGSALSARGPKPGLPGGTHSDEDGV